MEMHPNRYQHARYTAIDLSLLNRRQHTAGEPIKQASKQASKPSKATAHLPVVSCLDILPPLAGPPPVGVCRRRPSPTPGTHHPCHAMPCHAECMLHCISPCASCRRPKRSVGIQTCPAQIVPLMNGLGLKVPGMGWISGLFCFRFRFRVGGDLTSVWAWYTYAWSVSSDRQRLVAVAGVGGRTANDSRASREKQVQREAHYATWPQQSARSYTQMTPTINPPSTHRK